MKKWTHSQLTNGEEISIPVSLFIEPEKALQKFISANYVGETSQGLMLEFNFEPAISKKDAKKVSYKRFIDWASIYCEQGVRLYKKDGSLVRAYHVKTL